MTINTRALFASEHLKVYDIRCSADASTPVAEEQFADHSISLVRRGSFSCACRGRLFELVPGSVLLGHPGDVFTCSHEHHDAGDECLSFHFSAQWATEAGVGTSTWRLGSLSPTAGLPFAARAQCQPDAGFDEVGQMLLVELGRRASATAGDPGSSSRRRSSRLSARDRSRAVEAALWIESNLGEAVRLEDMARRTSLSALHFLRVFTRVVGVTPHQYLIGCRLRRAAALLEAGDLPVTAIALDCGFADLSNFIRSFGRTFGAPPGRFRRPRRPPDPRLAQFSPSHASRLPAS